MEPHNKKGLYKPTPGSYISFSGGARECIGKRFAQVELCAVLAKVLKEGRVELAVGRDGWEAARERAVNELSGGVGFGMALELFGKVELDFVARAYDLLKQTGKLEGSFFKIMKENGDETSKDRTGSHHTISIIDLEFKQPMTGSKYV